jgi:hypothetical protein
VLPIRLWFTTLFSLLALAWLPSCGMYKFQGYAKAFDPPGRQVRVVTTVGTPEISVSGPENRVEGAGAAVARSGVAILSVFGIPFIPLIMGGTMREADEMAAIMQSNPSWRTDLAQWFAEMRVDEIFRSEIQRHFQSASAPGYQTRYSSTDELLEQLSANPLPNVTVVVIRGVRLDMQKEGCPSCVGFALGAQLALIDGERAELILNDEAMATTHRQDIQPRSLADWFANDYAELARSVMQLAIKAASAKAGNFRVQR